MEGLRIQLRPLNIAVTTICPGFVKTPMTEPFDFHMPFVMEADKAARKMVKALARRRKVYNFPWQTALLMKLTRWLPDWTLATRAIRSGLANWDRPFWRNWSNMSESDPIFFYPNSRRDLDVHLSTAHAGPNAVCAWRKYVSKRQSLSVCSIESKRASCSADLRSFRSMNPRTLVSMFDSCVSIVDDMSTHSCV